MFDTAKVQRMLPELEQFARTHPEIYLIMQKINPHSFALLKRMNITPRALLINSDRPIAPQQIFGVPVMHMGYIIQTLNERTGVVVFNPKPQPMPQINMSVAFNGKTVNIPAFALSDDECSALYDRLTVIRLLQQYSEDEINGAHPAILIQKVAAGLTTFLDPKYQNIKTQFTDVRMQFPFKFDFNDAGIVIQGPLVHENEYTIQTARQYRMLYPNVPIVVSTWQNEATDAFRAECQRYSIVLLENELPSNRRGPGNVHYQIESSFKGLKHLKENTSVKFALKTRADQRFNRLDFLSYFKNLSRTFPPSGDRLQSRFVVMGRQDGLIKWIPFHVNDFMTFGTLDDLLKLYYLPRQDDFCDARYLNSHTRRWFAIKLILQRNEKNTYLPSEPTRKLRNFNLMINRFVDPEIYIMRSFYQKYIAPIDPAKLLETHLKFLHDYIVPVDNDVLNFDWFKYDYIRYYQQDIGMDQVSWLELYRNFKIDWV